MKVHTLLQILLILNMLQDLFFSTATDGQTWLFILIKMSRLELTPGPKGCPGRPVSGKLPLINIKINCFSKYI